MTAIVCRSMSATDGCVCNTMNGADWSKRYPLIVKDAARIKDAAIFDAEVVWLGSDGVADFDALHSRVNDGRATACAFDLLMLNDEDLRRKPLGERKAMLRTQVPCKKIAPPLGTELPFSDGRTTRMASGRQSSARHNATTGTVCPRVRRIPDSDGK